MRYIAVSVLLLTFAALAACDDGTGFRIDPLLATDTVELAAPAEGSALPSALDVTVGLGGIVGGRFPERPQDAEQWDVAVRLVGGQVALAPAGAIGLSSRAAITRAIPNRTWESLIEAPGAGSFMTDSAVVLQQGSVYSVRSRTIGGAFGACTQYAKLQPLALDPARGFVRLQITTNERCSDPRLAMED